MLLQAQPVPPSSFTLPTQPYYASFRHISPEGLSNRNVRAIVKDARGWMWFGTADGLNRFDGLSYYAFQHDERDSTSLCNNFVEVLFCDSRGVLWIGTQSGLAAFNARTERFINFLASHTSPQALSDNRIFSIAEDRTGALWIGTRQGLCRLDKTDIPAALANPRSARFTVFRKDDANTRSLSHNTARSLLFDREGTLYVGTYLGLNTLTPNPASQQAASTLQYSVERHFLHTNTTSKAYFQRHGFFYVQEDPFGFIWTYCYEQGLYRFVGKHQIGTNQRIKNPFERLVIPESGNTAHRAARALFSKTKTLFSAFLVGRDATLWIATSHQGLFSVQRTATGGFGQMQHYPFQPIQGAAPTITIFSLYADEQGVIWVGTDNGVFTLAAEDQSVSQYSLFAPPFKARQKEKQNEKSLESNMLSVLTLRADKQGSIWLAGSDGIWRTQTQSLGNALQAQNILSAERLRGVGLSSVLCGAFPDKNGLVWFGTSPFGIHIYDPKRDKISPLEPTQHTPNLNAPLTSDGKTGGYHLYSMLETRDSTTVWLGTSAGAYAYHRPSDTWKIFTMDAVSHKATHQASQQTLPNRPQHRLRTNAVYDITEDRFGNLWFATDQGLHIADAAREAIMPYSVWLRDVAGVVPNGSEPPETLNALALCAAPHGLWLGTQSQGLYFLPQSLMQIASQSASPSTSPSTSQTTSKVLSNLVWQHFTREDGLTGNNVSSILCEQESENKDGKNSKTVAPQQTSALWAYVGDHIMRLTMQGERLAAVQNYTGEQGIITGIRRNNAHLQMCLTRTQSDTVMAFASHEHLFLLQTNRYRPDTAKPRIYFTDLHILGKRVQTSETLNDMPELRLEAKQNFFTLSFTALSLRNASKIGFEYALEGFDGAWVRTQASAGASNSAPYTNVPPGNYTFHLRAVSGSRILSDERRLRIVIVPAFWQTWWFFAACVCAVVGMVWVIVRAIIRTRVEKVRFALERVDAERQRISHDIHDDVGAHLTKIALASELAAMRLAQHIAQQTTQETAQETAKETTQSLASVPNLSSQLHTIAQSAREATGSLSEIIWALNPANSTLGVLLLYIVEYAQRMVQDTTTALVVQGLAERSEEERGLAVISDVRHHTFLMVKEAVNNAMKYASATSISLTFELEQLSPVSYRLRISIADNGKGFDIEYHSQRRTNGLRTMQRRAASVGGRIDIQSQEGAGTRIEFVVELCEE